MQNVLSREDAQLIMRSAHVRAVCFRSSDRTLPYPEALKQGLQYAHGAFQIAIDVHNHVKNWQYSLLEILANGESLEHQPALNFTMMVTCTKYIKAYTTKNSAHLALMERMGSECYPVGPGNSIYLDWLNKLDAKMQYFDEDFSVEKLTMYWI